MKQGKLNCWEKTASESLAVVGFVRIKAAVQAVVLRDDTAPPTAYSLRDTSKRRFQQNSSSDLIKLWKDILIEKLTLLNTLILFGQSSKLQYRSKHRYLSLPFIAAIFSCIS